MDKSNKKLVLWTFSLYFISLVLAYVQAHISVIIHALGIDPYRFMPFYNKHVSDILSYVVLSGIFNIAMPLYVIYRFDIKLHEKTSKGRLITGIIFGVIYILCMLLVFDISALEGDTMLVRYGSYGMAMLKYIIDVIFCMFSFYLLYFLLIPRTIERTCGENIWGRLLAIYLSALGHTIIISANGFSFPAFMGGIILYIFFGSCSVLTRSVYITMPIAFISTFMLMGSSYDSYGHFVFWYWILIKLGIVVLSLGAFMFFYRKRLRAQLPSTQTPALPAEE